MRVRVAVVVALLLVVGGWPVGSAPVAVASVPVGTIETVNTGSLRWPVYVAVNGEYIEGSGGRTPPGFFRIRPDGSTSGGQGAGPSSVRCMPPLPDLDPERQSCFARGVARGPSGGMFYAWEQNQWINGPQGWQAGTYNVAGFAGDGGPAGDALLQAPQGLAFDRFGNLFIVDGARIRKVDPDGIITTVAGTGVSGFSGDGGPALDAQIRDHTLPRFLTTDPDGNVYFGDRLNARIRRIGTDGMITTIAGTGVNATSPDGAVAATSPLLGVGGLAVAPSGELLFTETNADKVRMIDLDGRLQTVAGTGVGGFSGDGGPATAAMLDSPWGLAFEADGDLLVADSNNDRVRRITFGTGAIAGRVTDPGTTPAAGVHVTLFADWPTWRAVASTTTDAAGDYRFDDVAWGRYQVRFFDGAGRYQRRWWNDQNTYKAGDPVVAAPGATTTADATLTPAVARLTGRITTPAGDPVTGAQIQVFTAQGYLAGTTTGPNGYYTLNALPPDDYTIRAIHPDRWAYHPTWSPGVALRADAVPLTINAGTTTADITFTTWN